MESIKEAAVNFVCSVDRDTRLDLLKALISCTPYDELKQVLRFVDNSKKRKSPNKHLSKRRRTEDADVGVGSVAQTSTFVAQTPTKPHSTTWWDEIGLGNFLALDCEMVTLHQKNAEGKFIQEAATVGIVDWKGDTVLNETIYHKVGSFKVNKYTKQVNGFEGNMLEGGKPLNDVRQRVKKLLDGKIIVAAGGGADLLCLGLEPSEFEMFDIQTVFRKWSGQLTKTGEKVNQPISLRSLHYHYFQKDIQSGAHSAISDARATINIFKDVYIPLALKKNPMSKFYDMEEFEFDHIQKL